MTTAFLLIWCAASMQLDSTSTFCLDQRYNVFKDTDALMVAFDSLPGSAKPTVQIWQGSPYMIDHSTPPGLVAAYDFNEGIGFSAFDAWNRSIGTLNATFWTPVGKYGNGISLSPGLRAFVSIPDDPSLDIVGAGTIEAWVNLGALNRWHGIIGKGSPNSYISHNYAMEINDSNQVECSVGSGSSSTITTSGTRLATAKFYHLACTWDGSMVRLFVNGVQEDSETQNILPSPNSSPLFIGKFSSNADYTNGLIDEVRIYNRALFETEIQSDMDTPIR